MSPLSIVVLALSMSADAFAASVGRGATLEHPKISEALRTGAVFGIIEAITPIIGWVAGVAASGLVQAIDHWIAFLLLGVVGGRMFYNALFKSDEAERMGSSLTVLAAAAIGTSLDAMAVGVSLALLEADILIIAAAIGFATFALTTGGTLLGRFVGQRLGRCAEAVAGVTLVLIGLRILTEHLTA
jgi:manganese efflux pump family protein